MARAARRAMASNAARRDRGGKPAMLQLKPPEHSTITLVVGKLITSAKCLAISGRWLGNLVGDEGILNGHWDAERPQALEFCKLPEMEASQCQVPEQFWDLLGVIGAP